MTWELYDRITLRNERVPDADADRQLHTAAEILRRFASQPGIILADEVGMGKTYVALAVAVSVVEATRRQHPVVVMVPTSVATKWPLEWSVFADRTGPMLKWGSSRGDSYPSPIPGASLSGSSPRRRP